MADELPHVILEINSAPGENILDTVRRLGLGGAVPGDSDAQAALHYSQYIIDNFDNSDLAAVLAASSIAQEYGSIWSTPFDSADVAAPVSPTEGQKYINLSDGKGYIRIGGAWVPYTPAAGQRAKKADSFDYTFDGSEWRRGFLMQGSASGIEALFDFSQSNDGRDVVGELVIHGNQPYLNGVAVTNDDPDGYPAAAFRTHDGKEHSAIGVAGWPNAGFLTGFWEVSDLEGVNPPPRRMMVATGMDPDGGGYGNWPRFWDEPETYRMGLGYFDYSDAMLDISQGTLQYFMPQGHDTSLSISQKYIASLFLGYAADNHVAVIGGDSYTTALSFAKGMNGTFTAVSEVAKIDLTSDAFLLGVGAQIGSEKLAVVTSGAHDGATLQVSSGSQYPLLLWNTNNSGDSNYMLAGRDTSFTAVGNIKYTASSGLFALNSTSDQNLKQRIGPYRPGDALRRLKVHEYLRLDEPLSEITIGMFAQEAYEQFPHSAQPGIGVPGDPDFTPWSLNMSFFVPPIIATIQDILDRLDAANI